MTLEEKMMQRQGVESLRKPEAAENVNISREDFELLDVEQDVIYYIFEDDGSVTIRKGVNV